MGARMGFFDRFKKTAKETVDSERYRMPSADPELTQEQEQANRDIMEAQVTADRAKRDS